MSQTLLDFETISDNSRENFIVSSSNKTAFCAMENWLEWNPPCLIIYGSFGCGKTHLANVWQQMSGACLVDITDDNLIKNHTNHTNFIVENLPDIDEEKLLHLYNHVMNNAGYLLITSRISPNHIDFKLPDLASRLKATQACEVLAPDDELLSTLLIKQFSDRQLRINKNVLKYILPRIDRSFVAVSELVNQLDKLSMAEGRNITIPFVRSVLGSVVN